MERVDTTERLAKLRRLMQENNVDVYSRLSDTSLQHYLVATNNGCAVVPSEDSHNSEYIAPCDARRGEHQRIYSYDCSREADRIGIIVFAQHSFRASRAPLGRL